MITTICFSGDAFQYNTTIIPSHSEYSVTKYFNSSQLDTTSIIIKVELSNESDWLCTLISIQDPLCPLKENLGEAMRFGVWSTMVQTGTIILDPEEWPRGLMIVLVTSASGDVCDTNGERFLSAKASSPHEFSITVGSNGTDFQTFKATIIVTACYLIIGLFSICISVIVFKFKLDLDDPESLETKSKVPGVVNPTFHEDEPVITALVHIGSTLNMPVNPTEIGENKTKKVPTTVSSISTGSTWASSGS